MTLTRSEYAVARERPELLLDKTTEGAPTAELNRCVGCGVEIPTGRGRKWCTNACRHRAGRNGGAVLASKPRKRTDRYEPPRKRTGQTSGAPAADVAATNGTQPEATHEGNGVSKFSIDRLLDAIGADVASVTVSTRSGVEVVVLTGDAAPERTTGAP